MHEGFPAGLRRAPTRRRVLQQSLAGAGGLAFASALIRRARADTAVKIGQIEALTGPSAAYGIRGRDGALLAVEEINAAGGVADGKGGKPQPRALVPSIDLQSAKFTRPLTTQWFAERVVTRHRQCLARAGKPA